MNPAPAPDAYGQIMAGVVVGIVEQTTGDPQKLGRIRVRFPWIGGTILSNWCRVASFFAGKDTGAYFLPARGTEVLVAFDAGNINVPYVIAALWNGVDTPPVAGEQAQQNVRMIKTSGGTTIRIDDTSGQEKIEITDKAGDRIAIDAKTKNIDISAGGNVTISGGGKLTLKAKQIEISATEGVQATGAQATIRGTKEVVVRGGQIRLN